MHQHIGVTGAIGLRIYFCEPNSPWKRDSYENMVGLLTAILSERHRAASAHPKNSSIPSPLIGIYTHENVTDTPFRIR